MEQHDRPALAALILFGGIVAVALMDVVGKILSQEMSVLQVTWARFFFHTLFLAPVALAAYRVKKGPVTAGRWRYHWLRGALIAASSLCFFGAIQKNPVPDALAVFFVEPFIVAALAHWLLGERLTRRARAASVLGLVGVLIVLRPGGGEYHWTIALALLAALFFAGYIVSARFAAFNQPALITSICTAWCALLLCAPFAWWFWTPVSSQTWELMAALGALAAVGHTLIVLSCRFAAASFLAVLHYSEVAVAAVLSWLIFMHFPDAIVWVGIAVIFAAKLLAVSGQRG